MPSPSHDSLKAQTASVVNPTSSGRANVTNVLARYGAFSVAVCRAGAVVALHFSTGKGTVIISCDLGDFVEAARGPLDHNGNSLPFPESANRPAPPVVIPAPRAPNTGVRSPLSPKLEAAWQSLKAGDFIALKDAAVAQGLRPQTLSNWLGHHHRDEWRRVRHAMASPLDTRPPVVKPNGKIL